MDTLRTTSPALPSALTLPAASTPMPPALDSRHLFAKTKEILIEHHGELYRLRLTRNDKIILTK
ncbi:hemin uptake protein HemP [Aquaspirillum serpens]|uniref:hemin uptake protein HemP n=1 Tax=Aquaspirillum serpens TaxID=190 RepID=UPI0003B4E323|nr:hemin uptake protein HemP [Aquaspirillum serpens]